MRILVVEDERRVASVIARALKDNAYDVDLAESGERALELAKANAYDSILLDVRLPGLSGIDVCCELRTAGFDTPILMLTARALVEQRVQGLDAGGDDYLIKPFVIAELLARVRALVRRRVSGGRVIRYADLELDRHRRRVIRAGHVIVLTEKEFGLLEFLITRSPAAVTRDEIIENVWGMGFDPHTNRVEVYINRLRQKMSETGDAKFIQTVHGVGYRLKASV
jgi:DNA-binding response OmpR family regulator